MDRLPQTTLARCRPRLAWALLVLACSWGAFGAGERRGEPSPALAVAARVVGRTDLRQTVRIRVELTVAAHVDAGPLRVRGLLGDDRRSARAVDLPERNLLVPHGTVRTVHYELDLARGRRHRVYFDVAPTAASGSSPRGRAYLELDLDPSRAPRDRGHVLEYRATSADGMAP